MNTQTILLIGLLANTAWVDASLEHTAKGSGTFASVGPGSSCTYDTTTGGSFQDAVDDMYPEIRLVNTVTHDGGVVVNYTLNLKGGYDSCNEAINDTPGTNKSTINANQSGTVLALNGIGLNSVERIILTGGGGTDFGGGLYLGGIDQVVSITDSEIFNNTAAIGGGGIFKLNTSGVNLNISNTLITNNTATAGAGGGINFQGAGRLLMYGNSEVSNNIGPKGGGMFLRNTQAVLVGGDNLTATSGVSGNTASTIGGGGLWIESSDVDIIGGLYRLDNNEVVGNPNQFFQIAANSIGNAQSGGGMYITGSSTLRASGLALKNNLYTGSVNFGGLALFVENSIIQIGAPFISEFGGSCLFEDLKQGCNFIAGNSSLAGGQVVMLVNSTADFSATQFSNNSIISSIVYAIGNSGMFNMSNSVIIDNNLTGLSNRNILDFSNNIVTLSNNTAVNNQADHLVFLTNGSSDIYYNYFYNPAINNWLVSNGTSVTTECLMLDNTNNSADPNRNTYVTDANSHQVRFVDLINRDLHLNDNSDLINFGENNCNISLPVLIEKDIDGEPRIDFPDLGADENLITDVIFRDGFETL